MNNVFLWLYTSVFLYSVHNYYCCTEPVACSSLRLSRNQMFICKIQLILNLFVTFKKCIEMNRLITVLDKGNSNHKYCDFLCVQQEHQMLRSVSQQSKARSHRVSFADDVAQSHLTEGERARDAHYDASSLKPFFSTPMSSLDVSSFLRLTWRET